MVRSQDPVTVSEHRLELVDRLGHPARVIQSAGQVVAGSEGIGMVRSRTRRRSTSNPWNWSIASATRPDARRASAILFWVVRVSGWSGPSVSLR